MRDVLTDECAELGGWAGGLLDACITGGVMTDRWEAYADAWLQKLDSDGAFHGEFWGKWFTSAANVLRFCPRPEYRALAEKAVHRLLEAQEPDGRLSCSGTDFTTWDLWGRKYALLGLIAWYDASGDTGALEAAGRALGQLTDALHAAGTRVGDTGLAALQGLAGCSILQPAVQLYLRTGEERWLRFARELVGQWSEPSAFAPRGLRLLEDALAGVPPTDIAAPKGYETMSCFEGVCELARATGEERYKKAAVAYAESILAREEMITGSGSSAELWCEGRTRQTALLEAPMETCVTATWMKLCHQLLRLTGEARWADCMEISLFNALSGAMRSDGAWWAYFSPLQGQRVPSPVQLPAVGTSCCVVNGPRALTEVPLWALMRRADGWAVCLYQPGVYTGGGGALRLRLETGYPLEGQVRIRVEQAPAGPFVLALRNPAFSAGTTLLCNGKELPAGPGWCEIKRAWRAGDELLLTLDVAPRLVGAPGGGTAKALAAGPVVLALDERFAGLALKTPAPKGGADGESAAAAAENAAPAAENAVAAAESAGPVMEKTAAAAEKNAALPAHTSLWVMNTGMRALHDEQLGSTYYRVQSLADETDRPRAERTAVPGARLAWKVDFLERPIHFWGHRVVPLVFCDYASCGKDFEPDRAIRVWFDDPLYTDTVFLHGTRRVVCLFAEQEKTL